MKFFGEIGEGEMFPPGHGIAWRRWDVNRSVTAPVPLNLIVGWARDFYMNLRHRTPTQLDKLQIVANRNGYFEGKKQGYEEGARSVWRIVGESSGVKTY